MQSPGISVAISVSVNIVSLFGDEMSLFLKTLPSLSVSEEKESLGVSKGKNDW